MNAAAALPTQPGELDAKRLIAACMDADIVLATAHYLNWGHKGKKERLDAFLAHNAAHPSAPLFDLIVFDEAHHTPAKGWRAVRKAIAVEGKTKILHTTATPFRSDMQKIDFDTSGPTVSLIDGLLAKERFVKDVCFMEVADSCNEQVRATYMLPDAEALVVIRAIARQLGLSRRNEMPHKALIVVGAQSTGSGLRWGDHLVKLVNKNNVRILGYGDDAKKMRVAALHSKLSAADKKSLIERFQRTDMYRPDTLDALITVSEMVLPPPALCCLVPLINLNII